MKAGSDKLADECGSGVKRGLDYLIQHYCPIRGNDSLARDLVAHFRMPYVFARLGRPEVADRAMDHISNEFFDGDGDLRRQGCKTRNSVYADYFDHYMNTWVVRGAAALERQQMAGAMLDYLKTQRDVQTGGIYSRRGSEETDMGATAAFGLAACDVGDVDSALAAGEFLGWVLDSQLAGDDLHLRFEGRKPVQQYPADVEAFYVIHADAEGQGYWCPGIAVALLTRLATESGRDAYAARARRFMSIIMGCADDKYATLASGKVGWGAKLLFLRTGETAFLDVARAVAENLIRMQLADGHWGLRQGGNAEQEEPAVMLDMTAEMSLWLFEAEGLFRDAGSSG